MRSKAQMTSDENQVEFWRNVLSTYLDLDCSTKHVDGTVDDVIELSPCYLFSNSENRAKDFLASLRKNETCVLKPVCQLDESVPACSVTAEHIPLLTTAGNCGFDSATYFRHLNTRNLGKVLLYADVLPSTMNLVDSSSAPDGIVIVAGRQTEGRGGRGDNRWLSPRGCAMFTVHVDIASASNLGRRLPFVQHLAAVALVDGIRTLPGYQALDIRIKWPNDVYCGRTGAKLGGLIVKSSVNAATAVVRCVIGCGLNVNNSVPTTCVNDVIGEQCPSLAPLTTELSIARAVTVIEQLLAEFERDGPAAILPRYYQLWMHRDAEVSFGGEAGIVRGLDEYGFLAVERRSDGRVLSVQPDGNSFDMLRNVVVVRQTTTAD